MDIRGGKWHFSPYNWFSWIPTVTSRRLDLTPCKQVEFSLCLSQHAGFSNEDLHEFVHVLPRALISAVFQSVCNYFLSSSKVLNEF